MAQPYGRQLTGPTLPIVGSLPFAPFLAAGLVATVLCRGSIAGLFGAAIGSAR
ncbi:MAG: hypothetical protein AB1505_13740 [Candidatus Latescibacterota bacterium]